MENTDTITASQVSILATAVSGRLQEIQSARRLSDSALVKEYPDLGSAKTWKQRLLAGNFAGLNLPRFHTKLLRIQTILDGGTPDETFYPDAPFAKEFRSRLQYLERQTNDRRIMLVLAANGTGKSSSARWSVAQKAGSRVSFRCRPTYRNKPLHICLGLARALGSEIETTSPAAAEAECINLLSGQPRTVFIDQAHEGGVAVMHLLRGFVDETPSHFVYEAYNTTYRQVLTSSADAFVEAQAFAGRCVKPFFDLYAGGTLPEDVEFHLRQLAGIPKDVAVSLSKKLTPVLRKHTNLRLLSDAIEAARKANDDDNALPDEIETQVFRLAQEKKPAAGQRSECEVEK
jgi:hypothetical protein